MIYKFTKTHYAPKDQETGLAFYVKAVSFEEMFEKVKKRTWWEDRITDMGLEHSQDDTEEFFRLLKENKGDDTEDLTNWDDVYYGVTTYTWRDTDITDAEYEILKRVGLTEGD